MTTFNSEWLARRIQEIVESPISNHSVIAVGVDQSVSRAYVRDIQDHLGQMRREDSDNGKVLKTM